MTRINGRKRMIRYRRQRDGRLNREEGEEGRGRMRKPKKWNGGDGIGGTIICEARDGEDS